MTSRFSLSTLPIGCGAGVASGLLFASLIGGSVFALPLFLLAPLPLMIAALGWGTLAGLVGAATALVTVGLLLGGPAVVATVLMVAAPAVVLSHLAGLARPVATDPAAAPTVEWYPLGRILVAAAVLVGVATIIGGIALGFDPEETAMQVSAAYRETIPATESPAAFEPLVRATVRLMPAFFPASWLVTLVVDLWLAGRVLTKSGRLARPHEDLTTVQLPIAAGVVFAATAAMAFVSGVIGLVAEVVAGALFAAHFLVGLAVVHVATRGAPMRPMLLAFLYGLMLVFTLPAVLVVVIGVTEPFFGLRRRRPPGGPS